MKTALVACSICALAFLNSACTKVGLQDGSTSHRGASGVAAMADVSDGRIQVPKDYRFWPKFLTGIDKPDIGQIRDIYINQTGSSAEPGDAFPDGTVSVMEIWKAKRSADGALIVSSSGGLIKDELSLVFLMAKKDGAGQSIDPALRTGDWVYAGYAGDGKTAGGPPIAACRSCHLKVADKDWIFRYDEYFAKRKAAE